MRKLFKILVVAIVAASTIVIGEPANASSEQIWTCTGGTMKLPGLWVNTDFGRIRACLSHYGSPHMVVGDTQDTRTDGLCVDARWAVYGSYNYQVISGSRSCGAIAHFNVDLPTGKMRFYRGTAFKSIVL